MAEHYQNTPNTHSTIIQGNVITGDLTSTSNIRFDGEIKGTLSCELKIVVGETGVVRGAIQCKTADIYGVVEGNIKTDELFLKSSAVIKGDIVTHQLSIEPGCRFSGNCTMPEDAPQSNK